MCRVLEVSRQGYSKWLKSRNRGSKHEALLALIKQVLAEDNENNDNYGVWRIFLALRNNKGYTGSYPTVCRVCRKNGITLKKRRKPNGLTEADKQAQKSENIIQQDFTAEAPNEKWLSDITEVPCADGKLYVAPVFDCFDGAIVGLGMDDNMRKELCINAFEQACRRHNAFGMIFHSDRGSQYTSGDFRASLDKYGATQSMCGIGRCYDNARMESFFATLKKEKLYRINTEELTMETVKSIIWRYIFSYYNNRRIYTTNDGYPPMVYRRMYSDNQLLGLCPRPRGLCA
jgi:transposase InsO family protein